MSRGTLASPRPGLESQLEVEQINLNSFSMGSNRSDNIGDVINDAGGDTAACVDDDKNQW